MIRRFALLQTFVAVARAGKMKQAAHDLALTPGAVSQRIRQLEEAAGRRLFTRTSTGVELSAAGEAMFVALAEPFQAIEAVDMELGSPSSRRVTVSTVPSFAAAWLVPRLATFARLCPDIEVAVEVGTRPVDLKREPIDLAIRHGLGKYPGLESTWESTRDLRALGSSLRNSSWSRAPIFSKTALPSRGQPIAWHSRCFTTSIARIGRFGSKPTASPRRTPRRGRRFRKVT
jgi:LysR family transcriptional regulator, glycine cleavage system transcriptional activator